MGDLVVRHNILGSSGCVEGFRNQGEAKSAGMEGEDYAMLDSFDFGRDRGVRNDGSAAGFMSGWGYG